ncbi:hypothetical protein ACQEVB_34005 [Pseudonocardia sp. CA-107938]|uniref:hypothetical protein n=1 Tax=Pseudonocardia sp. CA-107938 TaxID=3240021 RepID=UPI003D8C47D1
MTDPALDQVVFSLLTGTGVAFAVVLVLLGIRRLVQPRPRAAAPPVEEVEPAAEVTELAGEPAAPVEAEEQPGTHEGVEVPEPRDPAEAPVAAR